MSTRPPGDSFRSQAPLGGRSRSIRARMSSTSRAVFFALRGRRSTVSMAAPAVLANPAEEAHTTRARVRARNSQVSAARS